MKASSKRNVIWFVGMTYLVFWCLLGFTGWMISLKVPLYMQTFAKNLCAWSPTLALFILFRRLFPDLSVGEFLKRNFSLRVNPLTFVLILILQAAIAFLALAALLGSTGKDWNSVSLLSPSAALVAFVVTLTSGPMGEELGWRGYLLRELQKRHTLLASSLWVGIVWGFWHVPLWFLSGYSGNDFLFYIACFLVSIVSTSVIITVFYSRQWNLLIPIWIHLLFNLFLALVKIDLLRFIGWISLGYAALAIILVVIEHKRMLARPME